MERSQRKVPSACERCRKQKLKCDVERPCTLCVRAQTRCVNAQTDNWRFQDQVSQRKPGKKPSTASRRNHLGQRRQARAREWVADEPASSSPAAGRSVDVGAADSFSEASWNMSSTMTLVEQAFQQHDGKSPEDTEASALLARSWAQSKAGLSGQTPDENAVPQVLQRMMLNNHHDQEQRQSQRSKKLQAVEQDLMALLPDQHPAEVLLNNYFDRIHWYTLVFHQSDFRAKFRSLYQQSTGRPPQTTLPSGRVDLLALCLTVLAISLHYTSQSQKRILESYNIQPDSLREKLLTVLKLRSLDLVALGSLEMVQMSVLLGSYYLYHGEPEVAWPLCGAGLRIAQALNLHRKISVSSSANASFRRNVEARKRTWWAVYEIETFCSMLYGFPLSISDRDCDVEPLNPRDEFSQCKQQHEDTATPAPTLLHFKSATAQLSGIVRAALIDLYGTRHDQGPERSEGQPSRLSNLVTAVGNLNVRLSEWHDSLPQSLQLGRLEEDAPAARQGTQGPDDPLQMTEERIFRLQALSLKLSYENARILIHRPLLSFRSVDVPNPTRPQSSSDQDPFQQAMNISRDAALQISSVGSSGCLQEATDTYAIASVSLHLLTAGVTLCISMSLDPLSWQSYQSRMGIRRLMQLQSMLQDRSDIAFQGLKITKRLMSLAMTKEINAMFEIEGSGSNIQNTQEVQSQSEVPNATGPAAQTMLHEPDAAAIQPVQATSCDADIQQDIFVGDSSAMFDVQNLDFCENTSVTEALLEYEDAIGLPITQGGDQMSLDPTQDAFTCGPSMGQEQGWIWGWNPLN